MPALHTAVLRSSFLVFYFGLLLLVELDLPISVVVANALLL